MPIVSAKNLKKNYVAGDIEVEAIKGVDFEIEPASFVSFVGPSGSGKTTLLNMIGCLDPPSGGSLQIVNQDVSQLSSTTSAAFRGDNIGFIFQDFNLIPVLTVFENIEYPLIMVQNWSAQKRKNQVTKMLEAVGMGDQGHKFPNQISGGQKQRVAVARALVTNAKLVLSASYPFQIIELTSVEQELLGLTGVLISEEVVYDAEILADSPLPADGILSADVTLDISIDLDSGTISGSVPLTELEAADNIGIADLLEDLNQALADNGFQEILAVDEASAWLMVTR